MKERDKRRRGIATDNASGIDCVQFMEYAASFRWREVEDFFPQDQEAFSYTQLELRQMPQQDDAMPRCYGSCTGDLGTVPMCHPDWVRSEESLESLRASRELELVRRYGFTRKQARFFVAKQEEILQRDKAKEDAEIKKREERKRRYAGDLGSAPPAPKDLVPLTDEPTRRIEPELLKAMAKQRKIIVAKYKSDLEARETARVKGLEALASQVFDTGALREENLKILREMEKHYPYSAALFKQKHNL